MRVPALVVLFRSYATLAVSVGNQAVAGRYSQAVRIGMPEAVTGDLSAGHGSDSGGAP